MQFPLIGSCVLFGLYVVVKFVSKEYLDMLISAYFAALGSFGLFAGVSPPLTELLNAEGLKRFKFSINWQFWKKKEDAGLLNLPTHPYPRPFYPSGKLVLMHRRAAGVLLQPP